jgi:hypothetical protein
MRNIHKEQLKIFFTKVVLLLFRKKTKGPKPAKVSVQQVGSRVTLGNVLSYNF